MRRLITAAFACAILSGCEEPKYPKYAVDREKRAQVFTSCLQNLPAGPLSTQYNDWDEVVDSCSEVARVSSLYCYENCPPEPAARRTGGAE
jgi:hypothetical protein